MYHSRIIGGNYSKTEDAQKHSIGYYFMVIVLDRRSVNPMASVLWDKYGDETVNLFNFRRCWE